jgi:hypothetical protein
MHSQAHRSRRKGLDVCVSIIPSHELPTHSYQHTSSTATNRKLQASCSSHRRLPSSILGTPLSASPLFAQRILVKSEFPPDTFHLTEISCQQDVGSSQLTTQFIFLFPNTNCRWDKWTVNVFKAWHLNQSSTVQTYTFCVGFHANNCPRCNMEENHSPTRTASQCMFGPRGSRYCPSLPHLATTRERHFSIVHSHLLLSTVSQFNSNNMPNSCTEW